MKNNRFFIVLLLTVCLTGASVAGYFLQQLQNGALDKATLRNTYIQHLRQAAGSTPEIVRERLAADGPAKSILRDYLMTMDVASGTVPVQEFARTYERTSQTKLAQRTDDDLPEIPVQKLTTNLTGRTRAFLIDPVAPDRMWSGSVSGGLWRNDSYKDATSQWQFVDGLWDNLSVSCIAADPLTNHLYVGTGESYTAVRMYRESSGLGTGIWRSTDGGNNWQQLSTTLDFAYINDLVIREEGGQSVIYVGVASGIYKERDFSAAPSNGLFRSVDGGLSWTQVLPGIVDGNPPAVSDIELTADGQLYVGTMRDQDLQGGANLLTSENGTDWELLLPAEDYEGESLIGGRVIIESAPSDPDRIYVFRMGTPVDDAQVSIDILRDYQTQLIQTADGGDTWSTIPLPVKVRVATLAWHAIAISVNPADPNHVVLGGLNLVSLRNTDLVGSELDQPEWRVHAIWNADRYAKFIPDRREDYLGVYVHADIHQIGFLDKEGTEMMIATDGGLFLTESFDQADLSVSEELSEIPSFNGPVFRDINQGMATGQYYTTSIHPTQNQLMGGTQDNGTLFYNGSALDVYDKVSGGDGAFNFYDRNDDFVITSAQHSFFWLSNYSYEEQAFVNLYPSGNFINPCDYDDRLNVVYANGHLVAGAAGVESSGQDTLYIIDMLSVSREQPVEVSTTVVPRLTQAETPYSAIKVSPYTTDGTSTLLIGTQAGRLFKVTGLPGRNSSSVELNTIELPVGFISSVDFGVDEDHILVTFTNYHTTSVWLTRDGGNSWKNIERNLPDMPVRWGVFNKNNYEHILLATESGVWHIPDVSNTETQWLQITGLPNVRVDMIKHKKSNGLVSIATHGRGMYTASVPDAYNDPDLVTETAEELTKGITVFPNPVDSWLSVSTTGIQGQPFNAVLYDLNGKIVKELASGKRVGGFDLRYDVRDVSSGTYLLSVASAGEVYTQRVIKR